MRWTMKDQTVYSFNENNQLASVVDRNGNKTEYVYENGDRLVKIIDPVGIESRQYISDWWQQQQQRHQEGIEQTNDWIRDVHQSAVDPVDNTSDSFLDSDDIYRPMLYP